MKDVYLIGNAHIDPVWLWRKPEGLSEILATFRSALDRMAEFDDYVFTSACAAYYKWVLQVDPAMFAEIKNRMMEGRWSVVGGFWVQPDCNIPTGESFVRHLLYSQQFFIDKLWVKATVGYNVDSFGHNGSMPQILNKAGIGAYVFMRPDAGENPDIPGDMFEWESPDGSSVTALRISNGYGTWEAYEDKSGIESDSCRDKALAAFEAAKRDGMPRLCFYGIGNHGGGPSIRCLKTYERLIAERGDFCFSSVPFFLSDMKDAGRLGGLKKWKSDLQHHASGCYSANSQIKAANRRCEHALVAAEKYLALSSALAPADDFNVLNARLREAWEKVLFNQFHDILAGCSIREACDDALKEFASAEEAAAAVRDLALHRISWRIDTRRRSDILPAQKNGWLLWEIPGEGAPAVVFNPHSFALKWPVQINAKVVGIADGDGAPVESQTVRGPQTNGSDMLNTIFLADIPALGYATYYLSADCADGQKLTGASASVNALENEFVKVTFDALTGFISGMFDKECGRELLCGPSARPVVINDEKSDTWAHGIFEFADEAGEFRLAEIAVLENGPVRAAVRVRSVYGNSELTQDFQLFSGGRELIVRCRLDYRERLKMLKLSFNVKADSPRAVYSMPFGFIEKQADGLEEPSHEWMAAIDEAGGAGLALVNDSKYSFSLLKNDMRMVAARGCGYADHYGSREDLVEYQDMGEQRFTYALSAFDAKRIEDVAKLAAVINQPPHLIMETRHEGPLAKRRSGIDVSAENVFVTAIKAAEPPLEGLILRVVETRGTETDATIKSGLFSQLVKVSLKRQEFMTIFVPSDPDREAFEICSDETFP